MSSINKCNPCLDCPPPNYTEAENCNPMPQCEKVINTKCVQYTRKDINCEDVTEQERFDNFLIDLESQICAVLACLPSKPPCTVFSGDITATLESSTPNLKACFYNMQEKTSWMIHTIHCAPERSTTFTIPSVVINGIELITYGKSPISLVVSKSNLKIVTANNIIVVQDCNTYDITAEGVIYTNFVDLFNKMFTELNLTNYKAQIAYNQSITTPAPDGFYIIYPVNDTFSIKTTSNSPYNTGNLKYQNDSVTYWNDSADRYTGIMCSGISVVNGKVVENNTTDCGIPVRI